MFNKLRRIFGWKPIEERDYHDRFGGCVHHWNWLKNGQCPKCARGVLNAINWSFVDEETMHGLQGLIKAARK